MEPAVAYLHEQTAGRLRGQRRVRLSTIALRRGGAVSFAFVARPFYVCHADEKRMDEERGGACWTVGACTGRVLAESAECGGFLLSRVASFSEPM